jgi:uncharacterized protein
MTMEINMLGELFSFLLFFGTVFLITILMIRYFYFKIMFAFPRTKLYRRELKLFYLPIFAVPFIFSNRGIQGSLPITVLSYIIYAYFTFMFIFFLWGLTIELFIRIRGIFKKLYLKKMPLRKRRIVFGGLFLITFHTISSGFWMARDIKVEYLEIETAKVTERTRIVQISDTHFSQMLGVGFAKNIVEIVAAVKPDIIIHTGDFFDHSVLDPEGVFKVLRTLEAPLGKYAIIGNHEYINKIEDSKGHIKNSGFSIIENSSVSIGEDILLSSVTDISGKRFGHTIPQDSSILKDLDSSKFIVFLKHQPKLKKDTVEKFDLMLSGHTHAGQIFPFGIFVRMAFRYYRGTYRFSKGSILHVNRGTGTWGPPVRFGASAEITLIDIIPKD